MPSLSITMLAGQINVCTGMITIEISQHRPTGHFFLFSPILTPRFLISLIFRLSTFISTKCAVFLIKQQAHGTLVISIVACGSRVPGFSSATSKSFFSIDGIKVAYKTLRICQSIIVRHQHIQIEMK